MIQASDKIQPELEKQFLELVKQWRIETRGISSTNKASQHERISADYWHGTRRSAIITPRTGVTFFGALVLGVKSNYRRRSRSAR